MFGVLSDDEGSGKQCAKTTQLLDKVKAELAKQQNETK